MKKLLGILALALIVCLACTGLVFAEEEPAQTCNHVFETVYDNDQTVKPTCTVEGYGHRVCVNCGKDPEELGIEGENSYIKVPALGHLPGEPKESEPGAPNPAATCVEPGNYDTTITVKCERCGETLSEEVTHHVIPATGVHTWKEEAEEVKGTKVDATCVKDGHVDKAIFCKDCGAEKEGTRVTETIKSKGHEAGEAVVDKDSIKPATCIEPGSQDMVKYCKKCNIELERKQIVIETIDHIAGDPVKENVVEPTCVDKGTYELATYCTMCGMEMSRKKVVDEVTPLKPHQWELDLDNPNYVAPTCYREGTGYQYCTVCGAKNDDSIVLKKLDHNYGEIVEVPATCMEKGGKIQECKNEGCTAAAEGHFNYVEVYEIDPNGHKWKLAEADPAADPDTEGSVTRPATCTKHGVNAYVCEYNETHRYAEQVAPLGHEEVTIPEIKPTCEKVGYTAGKGCARGKDCDGEEKALPEGYPEGNVPAGIKVIEAPEVIPAKGHTKLDIMVPDSATCTKGGKITYKCAVCGEVVTDDTEAKGHNWVRSDLEDDPAGCTKDGYASWRCTNCGEEKREPVKATGEHQFTDWMTEEPTCKTAGRIYRVCELCGYEDVQEFIEIDEKAHDWQVVWEDMDIIVIDEKTGTKTVKTIKSDIKTYPGCVEDGFGKYVCMVCGKEKYESIPAWGHIPGDPVIEESTTVPGTYEEVVYCNVCGEELSREPVEVKNGLAQDEEGKWHYYTNNEIDRTKTGIVEFQGGEFWVVKGDLAEDANGLTICPDGKAYFLAQGQIQRKDGFAEYHGDWFMLKNGELDENANGLYDYDGGTFVFAAGKLRKDVNGLWQNPKDNKWYFLANGQVQKVSQVAEYRGEFFLVKDGILDTEYKGTYEYNGRTFIVVNGQLYEPLTEEEPAA